MLFTSYKNVRYQECPWYVRACRRLWMLNTPILALRLYFGSGEDPEIKLKWRFCWSLAIGLMQGKMKWYYTSDEVFDMLRERREERKLNGLK